MDYKINNLSLAAQGRQYVDTIAKDMPAIGGIIRELALRKPLRGAAIAICTDISLATVVVARGLCDLGASVRLCAPGPHRTHDQAAATLVDMGIPVFAWADQSAADTTWAMDQMIVAKDGWRPTLIMDHHGMMTRHIHDFYPTALAHIRGISEATALGARRLDAMATMGVLGTAAINLYTSPLIHQLATFHNIHQYVLQPFIRCGLSVTGKTVAVGGYGPLGQAIARALNDCGAHVSVVEWDPVLGLMAHMDGHPVVGLESIATHVDIVINTADLRDMIPMAAIQAMKTGTILMNLSELSTAIDMDGLHHYPTEPVGPHLNAYIFHSDKRILVFSNGDVPTMPEDKSSLTESLIYACHMVAQIDLWTNPESYGKGCHELPLGLESFIAKLQGEPLGMQLMTLSPQQRGITNDDH